MDATLLSFPSSRFSPPPQTLTLTRPTNPLLFSLNPIPSHVRTRIPTTTTTTTNVRCAISRTKKEETVDAVKQNLENCYLIAGINYKGFTVKQFQDLRKNLPDNTKLLVAKNTLVYKAIEGTPWEALKPCMTGMNVWLFVHTEEIPSAIKPYRDFQKERKLDTNDFTGAVFEGKFYGPENFKDLETMPTRAEIYAKLLGTLQGPASKLVGTIQAPARELVMLLKAYVNKLEQEGGGGGQ